MRAVLALLLLLAPGVARAQPLFGTTAPTGSGSVVTPTGATGSASLGDIAAQQGVLLDAFRVAADTDDTASMTRAVASGVPILLGPKTYTINNFTSATAAQFIMRGVPGKSIIQRTSASGANSFTILATNVFIDGVTFDLNSSAVSANQWGVLLSQGGQNVTVRNSVFKNNSGTLGSCFTLRSTGPAAGGSFSFTDNEATNCSFNSVWFGSVSNGVVARNYVHDTTAAGIQVSSYLSSSSTNYAADVDVVSNRVMRNVTGVAIGGFSAPYTYGTPSAVRVRVTDNTLQDNSAYQVNLQGDFLSAVGNHIDQSASSVSVLGGIDCNSRWTTVSNNTVALDGATYGIDCGGSVGALVTNNLVSMTTGAALDGGGNLNGVYSGNHMILTGTAFGLVNYEIEGDGQGTAFPTVTSGVVIENNTFDLVGATTTGVALFDNPGGRPGSSATILRNNHFNASGGANVGQDIVWYGGPASLTIDGNTHNGTNGTFADPNVSGDVVFDPVYFGGTLQGISSTVNIRSIQTVTIATYGAGGSILWVYPTAAGSGYVCSTTTLAASSTGGGSGWTGTALCNNGTIVGVKTTAFGSGYSGTFTVTATDSSGGTGATFFVGHIPLLPQFGRLTYQSATTHLLLKGGAFIPFNINAALVLNGTTQVTLQALGTGGFWDALSVTTPIIAIGSLPTCNASSLSARALVSGSVSGKWEAMCNATNWIAPDGTTIN